MAKILSPLFSPSETMTSSLEGWNSFHWGSFPWNKYHRFCSKNGFKLSQIKKKARVCDLARTGYVPAGIPGLVVRPSHKQNVVCLTACLHLKPEYDKITSTGFQKRKVPGVFRWNSLQTPLQRETCVKNRFVSPSSFVSPFGALQICTVHSLQDRC